MYVKSQDTSSTVVAIALGRLKKADPWGLMASEPSRISETQGPVRGPAGIGKVDAS